ncbi:hypothetical protein QWY15_08295 [Planococcus sp. N064]|uniref:Uncharacterized protein n=1 Tax=Planococcus liqunii TaxID=3058394 RepID=A0ABT8MQV7_9BACL|nr:hypothetical protein [Planococcus sp. N064]MDN7227287.1 hypothetical protein [Planococcus sp. N064]
MAVRVLYKKRLVIQSFFETEKRKRNPKKSCFLAINMWFKAHILWASGYVLKTNKITAAAAWNCCKDPGKHKK